MPTIRGFKLINGKIQNKEHERIILGACNLQPVKGKVINNNDGTVWNKDIKKVEMNSASQAPSMDEDLVIKEEKNIVKKAVSKVKKAISKAKPKKK